MPLIKPLWNRLPLPLCEDKGVFLAVTHDIALNLVGAFVDLEDLGVVRFPAPSYFPGFPFSA